MQKAKPGYKLVKSLFGKYEAIPEEWEVQSLSKVCKNKPEYGSGDAAISFDEFLPRYVRITDIDNNGNLKKEKVSVKLENNEKYVLENNDFLFARTGSVGRTFLYYKKYGKCVFAGYLIRFRLNEEKLLPLFLKFYTHGKNYWVWIQSELTHGVQQNLNAQQYSKLIIPIPPIKQQQKIATILSNVDNLIESYEKAIQATKKLKKGLMQTLLTRGIGHKKFKKVKWLFGKGIEIPVEWEIKNIIDIGEKFGDAPFGSMLKNIDFTVKGIPIARGINIKNNCFLWTNPLYTSKEKFESLERSHCQEGDLGFQKIGNSIGDVAIMPKIDGHRVYLLSTNMMKMSVNPNITMVNYVYYYFSMNKVRNFIKLTSHGSAKPIFNFTSLKKFKIIIPSSISEQQKIVSIISSVDDEISKLELKKKSAESLKKGLMQKLLTGQIRVKV